MPPPTYDALLLVSFGGPEAPEDVIPFLENVTRGRNVPRARLEQVAEHYYHFGGRSPINAQCRDLIAALEPELESAGLRLPIYWGNRNWHPFLPETMRSMAADGVRRAAVFVTSAYSSYSACRQYLDDIESARLAAGPGAPQCEKLRHFHAHPGFTEPNAEAVRAALAQAPGAELWFTAHSIPVEKARTSHYVQQLEQTAALVTTGAGAPGFRLVYQSRSGSPREPWLGPDILEALTEAGAAGLRQIVVSPIGFMSDHMEVLYDLDYEASRHAAALGIEMHRAATAGAHPRFVRMIRELVEERIRSGDQVDPCRQVCCEAPFRPFAPPTPVPAAP